MHLQRDGTHTWRKAIENKGLVLVLNNVFDKCLQTQQPFWRKSIFPCLAAGTVLLGQLRLFVLGWSPTFSCCQTSYTNELKLSMKHFISLLQLIHISAAEPPVWSCLLPLLSWPGLHRFPCGSGTWLCSLLLLWVREIRFYSTCCIYRGWSLPAQKPLSRLWDVCETEV